MSDDDLDAMLDDCVDMVAAHAIALTDRDLVLMIASAVDTWASSSAGCSAAVEGLIAAFRRAGRLPDPAGVVVEIQQRLGRPLKIGEEC